MKKNLMLVIILLLLSLSLSAVVNERGFGFTAGKVSGIGLAYRQYNERNGFQFTVGLLSSSDRIPKFPSESYNDSITKTGWDVDGWVSAMYINILRESEFNKFYWFFGASMNIDYKKKYTQEYDNAHDPVGNIDKKVVNDNAFYFGPGIGVDFRLSKYVSFNIELPISISSDSKIDTYIPQGAIIVRF